MQGTLERKHAGHIGTWTRKYERHVDTWALSTQDMLARKRLNMQCTLAREHVSTQGTLAREHVSKQGMLVREHVFSTYGKQFSRLEFKILVRASLNSLPSCTHVLWYTTLSTISHFVWEIFENLWYRCMYHRKKPVFVKAVFLGNYRG